MNRIFQILIVFLFTTTASAQSDEIDLKDRAAGLLMSSTGAGQVYQNSMDKARKLQNTAENIKDKAQRTATAVQWEIERTKHTVNQLKNAFKRNPRKARALQRNSHLAGATAREVKYKPVKFNRKKFAKQFKRSLNRGVRQLKKKANKQMNRELAKAKNKLKNTTRATVQDAVKGQLGSFLGH